MSSPQSISESSTRGGPEVVAPLHGDFRRSRSRQESSGGRSPFVPLVIFFLAAAGWSAFQFQQLELESDALHALRANQEAQLQQAQKVRATLDAMAVETQKLADAGNTNARLVVEELRKRGVTINRPAGEARN